MLENLGNFLLYFGAASVLLGAFLALYTMITPTRDWELIRAGNTAVAVALAGATLGFVLPLAMAIARSHDLADMVLWAAVALVVQLLCYAVVRRFALTGKSGGGMESGDMAEAILIAAGSVTLGILNAACLT